MRERAYQQKEYTPVGNVDDLVSGTYHLVGVDGMFKRSYEVKE